MDMQAYPTVTCALLVLLQTNRRIASANAGHAAKQANCISKKASNDFPKQKFFLTGCFSQPG
jgi:hypothetical protein